MITLHRDALPEADFTGISRSFHRDTSLSVYARAIGAWLMTHTEGWVTTVLETARRNGVSRDRAAAAFRELEAAGYLTRTRARNADGTLGDVDYRIRCRPAQAVAEDVSAGRNQRLDNQDLAAQTHKKPNSKETTKAPSRGEPASPAPVADSESQAPKNEERQDRGEPRDLPQPAAPAQEVHVPRRSPAQDAPGLFDAPPAVRPQRPAAAPSAATVVGAYVTAYSAAHGAHRPPSGHTGRVARDAKALIAKGEPVAELEAAATAMGAGEFSNLAVALSIHRQGGKRGGSVSRGMFILTPDMIDNPERYAADSAVAEAQRAEIGPEEMEALFAAIDARNAKIARPSR